MKIGSSAFLFVMISLAPNFAKAAKLSQVIHFATQKEAAQILGQDDPYIRELNLFNLTMRFDPSRFPERDLNRTRVRQEVAAEALGWNEAELQELRTVTNEIDEALERKGINLNLPIQVNIVKATNKSEFEFNGYTRLNSMILKSDFVLGNRNTRFPDLDRHADLKRLVSHELWHILSRYDSHLRDRIFQIFGFTSVDRRPKIPGAYLQYVMIDPDDFEKVAGIKIIQNGVIYYAAPVLLTQRGEGRFWERVTMEKVLFLYNDPQLQDYVDVVRPKQINFASLERFNTIDQIEPDEIAADNFSFIILGSAVQIARPNLLNAFEKTLRR